MKQESRLAVTQRLFEAILGTIPRRTQRFEQILHTLGRVGRDVIVELPWSHQGHRHLLRLKKLNGDRLYFSNPVKSPGHAPGSLLTDGLRRRVEADGLESARITDMRYLFETGEGEALLL